MKSRTLMLVVLTGLASLAHVEAATQLWNPSGNPNGAGTWSTAIANWDSGPAAVWTNGNTASFTGTLMAGSVDLSGAISAVDLKLGTNTDLTIASNATGNSLTVTGTAQVPVTAGQPAHLTFLRNNGEANITHTFSGTGIIGGGSLTLDKQGSPINPTGNLFVALTGPTTSIKVDAGIALTGKGNLGLVGFVATGAGTGTHIDSTITNSSAVVTFLGASAGNKITVNNAIDSTPGIQIGSQSLGYTGTVALGATGIIGDTNAINLSGGTLLVGSTVTNGGSETMGALTLSANSIIDFGALSSGYTLHFASTNLATWTGGLSIYNYTPGIDHLFFDSLSGPTATAFGPNVSTPQYGSLPFTSKITFYTGSGSGMIGGSAQYFAGAGPLEFNAALNAPAVPNYTIQAGQVVPVPEPTALLSAGLLLLAIAWKERRLFARVRSTELGLPLTA